MRLLNDISLRQLIADEVIKGPISSVEPASIDLPLGREAYILRTPFLPSNNAGSDFSKTLERFTLIKADMSQPLYVAPRTTVLVKTDVTIDIPEGMTLGANAKSSTGRVDVLARTILPRSNRYDQASADGRGPQPIYIEITPLTFPIMICEGITLTQIRLARGNGAPIGGTLSLSIDLSADIIGYRARTNTAPIHFGKNGSHRPEDYFTAVRAPDGEAILDVDAFYILQTKERISIPADACGEMLAYDISTGDARWHYAGFIDPSFGLRDPSRLVLELRARDVPLRVVDGQPIASVNLIPLTDTPSRPYGHGRASYQGQGLRLSRLFT